MYFFELYQITVDEKAEMKLPDPVMIPA
jgi:hypothetical protein